ncbi:MAG: L-threonylcarbamoyladenylate synthase [Bacteroidetes bacterium]|nr:L-threonylcarbamoyladenylate synthase [Bacteroidota bacterium]
MSTHSLKFKQTIVTDDVSLAAQRIRLGGLVAFPTETVFGLGANALDTEAVQRLFVAKGRPADNPLIVHVANPDDVRVLTSRIPSYAETLMEAFFPGPLTLVLPRAPIVPDITTAGLETVAIRMPDHEIALDLIRQSGMFIAAPSANRSGRPSPTTWEDVFEDLDGRIDLILKGTQTQFGLESTVVDCTGDFPVILRPGSVSLEELTAVQALTVYSDSSELSQRSPGTNHRHYQPNARVLLVPNPCLDDIPRDAAFIGLAGGFGAHLRYEAKSVADYAHHLFSFFRRCEKEGIRSIYCQKVPAVGIGRALMDRLERAAN